MSKNIMLMIVLIMAFTIRFWQIDQNPPSLFADEVDIAYQVKVFNTNHSDYFGNKFPIHFHSFADWRTSLQIYSSVLVSRFTSNDFIIVRLPAAIYSTLCILLLYLITGSLYAPILLTISPWSIHYGRTGFEVSGMLACLLATIYFFKKNKIYLSLLFLCLSLYFYSTAKLFAPVLVLILIFVYKDKLKGRNLKKVFLYFIFCSILLLPMALDTIRGHSGFRFSYISVFSIPHREQITDTLRYQDIRLSHTNELGVNTPLYSKIIHNKIQISLSKIVTNYLQSFSTNFLFINGDNNIRHGFGNHGLLYIIDFFTIFIGIFIYKNKVTKIGKVFFWILLLSPIPFALTSDSNGGHSTRLILMLPSLIYFSSLALKKYKYLIIIYFLLFLNFWHYYTIHYPQESAAVWHYNLRNAVKQSQQYNYTQIYFSDSFEPFLPFFLNGYNYPIPIILHDTNTTFFTGKSLNNKYYFGNINWAEIKSMPQNSLVVIPESDNIKISGKLKLLKILPKTYEMAQNFYIYTTNDQ